MVWTGCECAGGKRATAIYLVTIALFSVLFGLAVDQVYGLLGINASAMVGQAAEWVPPWAQLLGALTLLALSVKPVSRSLRSRLRRTGSRIASDEGEQGLAVEAGAESTACAGAGCGCAADPGSGIRGQGSVP